MNKKRHIQKTPARRMRDCEAHLYFLWDARCLYPEQNDRYKQIAAELRILVCERSKKTKPLLLECMDSFAFSYEVQPPGPPFDKQPIPMVGWRNNPKFAELSRELREWKDDKPELDQLLEKQAALRRPVPFLEYANRALAVYLAPYEYSYCDLTLAIAQQMGSSHEASTVEEPIVQMQQFKIGGDYGHVAPLIAFADLVIKVGAEFLTFMVSDHSYQLSYFRIDDSSTTGVRRNSSSSAPG